MSANDFPSVFLIGPRCSGKTTVGRILAERLGFVLCDTDALILESGGESVAGIVQREGWEGFREREARALAAAVGPGRVIATGGGMVLRAENRLLMRQSGLVCYLAAPLDCLCARMARGGQRGKRPSLTGADAVDEMARILAEREALYRECAHHSVDASVPAARVARAIRRILQRTSAHGGAAPSPL